MAEAAPQYGIKVTIERQSRGTIGGSNAIKLYTGSGAYEPTTLDRPSVTSLELNDAQVTGLFSYIALIKAGIDTSSVETAVATLLAAS